MSTIVQQLDDLVDQLAARGLSAAWEVEKFNAPGVFIKLLRSEAPFLSGDYQLTVQLIAAVPDRKHRTVLADLQNLIDQLQAMPLPIEQFDYDTSLELTNKLELPAAATTITL